MQIKLPAAYDTSRYEDIPDFTVLNPFPVLVITKATEGYSWVDPKFHAYYPAIKAAGIHRGAYHFHRKAYSAQVQADNFIKTVRSVGYDSKDIFVLDVEEGGESAAQLRAWFELVMAAFPGNQFMIYSRKNLLDPISFLLPSALKPTFKINMTVSDREFFRQIPVWTAGYPYNPDNYSSPPAAYIPDQTKWGPVWMWQYSDVGIVGGINGGVDLNWLSPELLEYLGQPEPPEPEPPKGDNMYTFVSNNHTMTLREAASDHVLGAEISAHAPTAVFTGDFLQFYPVDMEYARIGDFWMHVTAVDGAPVEGWVAVVHQGTKYGDVTFEVTGNPTKVFPDEIVASIDGETKTYDVKS